eukprot:TRINITY_DN8230_c1_g5_i1.p1 TRINITY_DN8230_c1_g5~~TRINITY_DN8230_c1_g5_i1.p1  ORF type:complete len:800 (-),score=145.21 TRINITY_DN8230_c1_g5_i1:303-2702(-)
MTSSRRQEAQPRAYWKKGILCLLPLAGIIVISTSIQESRKPGWTGGILSAIPSVSITVSSPNDPPATASAISTTPLPSTTRIRANLASAKAVVSSSSSAKPAAAVPSSSSALATDLQHLLSISGKSPSSTSTASTGAPTTSKPSAPPSPGQKQGSTAGTASNFFIANVQVGSCPSGTKQIEDADACSAAAKALGKNFSTSVSEGDPPGCLFRREDQDLFFNTFTGGQNNPSRVPVCRGTPPPGALTTTEAPLQFDVSGVESSDFVMGEAGEAGEAASSDQCPESTSPIKNMTVCQVAAQALGKKYHPQVSVAENDPDGCLFRIPDQDVVFNTNPGGPANPARQQICSTKPAAAPVTTLAPSASKQSETSTPPPSSSSEPASTTTMRKAAGPYIMSENGNASCPSRHYSLTDIDICADAASVLGLKLMSGDPMDVEGDPSGCVVRVFDQDVYFNTNKNDSTVKQDRQVVCSNTTSPKPKPPYDLEQLEARAKGIKVFCFSWTPFRPHDMEMLPEVRKQFSKCDGHAFFSHRIAENPAPPDVVKVSVPAQDHAPGDEGWLYHRNMVGLMPSWKYMIENRTEEHYDWILNAELDHFVSPNRVRLGIASYLHGLETSSPEDKSSVDGPMMLMWGNVFLFNKKMVEAMRKDWARIGEIAPQSSVAKGCPQMMEGKVEWPQSCSQDIVYPEMGKGIMKNVKVFGNSGCGQPEPRNHRGKPFLVPMMCWEMQQNPLGMDEEGEINAIKQFAMVKKTKNRDEALKHIEGIGQQQNAEKWLASKYVPVIHHIVSASVHKAARELLEGG